MNLLRFDHAAITVADPVRTAHWYEDVLGLVQVHRDVWGHAPAMMVTKGQTGLAIFPPGVAEPHLAFGTDELGFHRAQAELTGLGIEFRYEDHGPTESIYFHDLNGQKLEITRRK